MNFMLKLLAALAVLSTSAAASTWVPIEASEADCIVADALIIQDTEVYFDDFSCITKSRAVTEYFVPSEMTSVTAHLSCQTDDPGVADATMALVFYDKDHTHASFAWDSPTDFRPYRLCKE